MKTELTIEESQRLIELGVDPKLASKYQGVSSIGGGARGITRMTNPKPIFTLADILSILPKEIRFKNQFDIEFHFSIETKWQISKKEWKVEYGFIVSKTAPELIDALYSLLCWCLVKGFVKPKNDNQ